MLALVSARGETLALVCRGCTREPPAPARAAISSKGIFSFVPSPVSLLAFWAHGSSLASVGHSCRLALARAPDSTDVALMVLLVSVLARARSRAALLGAPAPLASAQTASTLAPVPEVRPRAPQTAPTPRAAASVRDSSPIALRRRLVSPSMVV